MWVDKDEKSLKPFGANVYGVFEDEEEIEKQEKYEAEYNFRYEEGAGDRVLGHSRIAEGSVRKKENARKVQRKSKKERMAQAELERKEELKRLKNLKRKEIVEKLNKIRAVADPDFCSDRDEDDDDLRKPNFEKEDELLGLPKGWDWCGSGEGFLAAREKTLQCKPGTMDVESSDQDQKEEESQAGSKHKRNGKMSLEEKTFQDNAWDEYYNLDYEDTIGDIKTRFKYTSVPSKRYGLSAAEILMMDDSELNQYVSLKKLAPYREREWKVHNIKRYEQKMKNKLLLQGENVNAQRAGKKHRSKAVYLTAASATGSMEQGEVGQLNGEVATVYQERRSVNIFEELLNRWRADLLSIRCFGTSPRHKKEKRKRIPMNVDHIQCKSQQK
ncbi:hypothetical protein NE237_004716 [Protea cynaroides]|uniref:Kri1-like C-terminal domain-containing protein n=1 Tax=Protea cynaroides TaxID=273540 RepID=A0A9Q0KJA3_9MAGN|nr:hypothetical protein NE237_004716 [Protea cynaroides]